MLDLTTSLRLEELYNKYNPLYKERASDYREEAFNEMIECLGMILKEYEDECDEMAKWYEAQEQKMEQERIRISLDRSDELYDAKCEYEIAERCENQG